MKIIIPAYEPNQRVLKLIDEIKSNSDYGIILVDDGSDIKYQPIFDQATQKGCIVLVHTVNQGKGAALKTAFSYLLDIGTTEPFICADCDGQHTWPDINKIATAIPDAPTSIVLGCRKFVGKVPFKSMLGNKMTRAIFSLLTGNKISDTQTGLRGFSATMLPWLIKINGNRYEYEMNQLLEAKRGGFGLYCIPIETIYENNNEGSHFHPIRDSIRIYLPIVKFSMSSVVCGILDFGLLFLLKYLTNDLLVAVVVSRVISSLCNYLLNKHFVFDVTTPHKTATLFQYYLLVIVILSCNYLLISFLNETADMSLFLSKLLTEGILFLFSFIVQHKLIFHDKTKNL